MNRLPVICGVALLGAIVLAVAAGPMDQKGGQGMFGLFGGKKTAETATVVAPELGTLLQKQSKMPQLNAPASQGSDAECRIAQLRGHAPTGEWVPEVIPEQTQPVFIVPGTAGQPALAILADSDFHLQVWELSSDKPARFIKRRTGKLDAAQEAWGMYFPLEVACLPGHQVAVAVGYTAPMMKRALYLYAADSNQFHRIDGIESDMSGPPPFSSFETLAVSPTAKLVNYRTGVIRLAAENYVYRYNHILLFSPSHPQGLEVIKLGLDDGNLREWAMQGETLWLRTHDKRKPTQDIVWSLDLQRVL
jgi:hypothetical protein